MLVTPDTGIGEQILDVEKTTVHTVELVIARAISIEPPRDRDLIEIEVDHPLSVINNQGHLCPTQRRTGRRAGKDDILHLLGAESLGGLRAQHP